MPVSVSDEVFAELYNDIENYPTQRDVANALGLALQTVKNRAALIRKRGKVELISRAITNEKPIAEESAVHHDWTPEECIESLREVAKIDTERFISRNYYRSMTHVADSTWNRHFGTFEEFKRQGGLGLSRQQSQLEKHIAKHASVDHYRRLSESRADWGEKYVRIDQSRFKTIMVVNDIHDIEVDPFWLRVVIDAARRAQPDIIVFNGDVFDLAEFGRYTTDPREWDVVGRIKFVHDNVFRPLREVCPDAQFDFIEGNHEARLIKHLADATPALRAVLSDLHGFTIGKLFGLDEFEINYIAKADLGAFSKRDMNKEIAKNYKTYFDSVLLCHFPDARSMGLPGANGHHHSHVVWSMFNPMFGSYEWHQFGCGHKRDASYARGEKWNMGFGFINVDTHTRQVSFDYSQVTDYAVVGGKWYHREAHEEAA